MPNASSKKALSEILSEIRKRGKKPGCNVRIERATWSGGGMGSTPKECVEDNGQGGSGNISACDDVWCGEGLGNVQACDDKECELPDNNNDDDVCGNVNACNDVYCKSGTANVQP